MHIILNIIKPSKGEENGKQYTFQWIYRGEVVYNDIVRLALNNRRTMYDKIIFPLQKSRFIFIEITLGEVSNHIPRIRFVARKNTFSPKFNVFFPRKFARC